MILGFIRSQGGKTNGCYYGWYSVVYWIRINSFLPVIIFIIGLFFGLKPSKAFISGVTVGIGNIGLGLVLDLLSGGLGSAIQQMGEKFGTSLNVLDIGVGVGGPLAFSTSFGNFDDPYLINFEFYFSDAWLDENIEC